MKKQPAATRRSMDCFIAGGILASVLMVTAISATEATDLSPRLMHVERLLSKSSAAMKVKESGKSDAIALKAAADASLQSAKELNQQGDFAGAEGKLREAIRLLSEAARAAGNSSQVSPKQSGDYELRRNSVDALASAHDRVATEKGLADANSALQAMVAKSLAASDALLAEGDAVAARALLDATYDAVKTSIESMRGGDTLVRELNFESPEDEYRYELDRNDTHRMLVEVLFAEKLAASPMRGTADTFLEKADDLRTQAVAASADADFKQAIELLEQSTKELIRAIRSAGVYIPG